MSRRRAAASSAGRACSILSALAGGDQLDEILVALVGLREQHQVIGLGLRAALLEAASLRHVDLAAEDRLESALTGMVVEHDRREHVAVLGHRQRRHLQLDRFVQELVDAAGAVEQRELGMKVKVDEVLHFSIPDWRLVIRC
jgi:hypothetical protein